MDDLSLSCCHHLLVCNPPCLSHPWHLALIIHLCVVWWFREGGMEGFIAGAPSFRHRRRSLVRRVGRPVAQPLRTLAHNLMRSVPPAAPSATASMYINLSHSANPLWLHSFSFFPFHPCFCLRLQNVWIFWSTLGLHNFIWIWLVNENKG